MQAKPENKLVHLSGSFIFRFFCLHATMKEYMEIILIASRIEEKG